MVARRDSQRERPLLGRALAHDLCEPRSRSRQADQALARPILMADLHALRDAALAKAKAARDADLADLVEELRIPSVSTLPERRDDCVRNAHWLRDRMAALGMKVEIIDVIKDGNPVVIADWNGALGKPHLTIYG